jgi:hypothetical protein
MWFRWISSSIGVTLCESCAQAHRYVHAYVSSVTIVRAIVTLWFRHLTWAVSKLKNIHLDNFSEWQLKIMHYELGNNLVNSIWECNVPIGWEKPSRVSATTLFLFAI